MARNTIELKYFSENVEMAATPARFLKEIIRVGRYRCPKLPGGAVDVTAGRLGRWVEDFYGAGKKVWFFCRLSDGGACKVGWVEDMFVGDEKLYAVMRVADERVAALLRAGAGEDVALGVERTPADTPDGERGESVRYLALTLEPPRESRGGALPRRAGREKVLALEARLAALGRRNLELGRELCALRAERLRRADAAAAAEAADLVEDGKIPPACAPYVKALLAAGDDVPVWLDGRLTSAAALLREILEAMPPYERAADAFPEKRNYSEALCEDAGGCEMTALTANYDAERKDGILVAYKVAARTVIYKGAMACLNRAGYAVPAADEAGLTFVGVAYERGDNAAGDDGDVSVRVWKDGSFRVAMSSPTLEDLGAAAYVVDDNAVALSSANSVLAGTVVEIPAQGIARILIRNAVK